jgi:hypothetical protein
VEPDREEKEYLCSYENSRNELIYSCQDQENSDLSFEFLCSETEGAVLCEQLPRG